MTSKPNLTALCLFALLATLLTACNFSLPEATPTVEALNETPVNPIPDRPEATATPTASLSPTISRALLESATPTGSPLPPSETPSPTPTLGPYEHTVQADENLLQIVSLYGYRDLRILDEVTALNGLSSPNDLRVGQLIRIPRQTATPTPQGYEMTAVMNETLGITPLSVQSQNREYGCHQVQEGETVVDIATYYGTTLEVLRDSNPQLIFPSSCDYNIKSGGPGCGVLINIGQCINVPLPTPTRTLSPTPSGSETPTPTPTYAPPHLITPPENGTVRGIVTLEWVGTRVLKPGEAYFLEVIDTTVPGEPFTAATRENTYRLPETLIPGDGQTHTFAWRVFVAAANDQGVYRRVGDMGISRTFQWQSR